MPDPTYLGTVTSRKKSVAAPQVVWTDSQHFVPVLNGQINDGSIANQGCVHPAQQITSTSGKFTLYENIQLNLDDFSQTMLSRLVMFQVKRKPGHISPWHKYPSDCSFNEKLRRGAI
jgi:hypothetical protein